MSFEQDALAYKDYYSSHYPYALLASWFTYFGQIDPEKREWSSESTDQGGDTFVRRYIPVRGEEDLRKLLDFSPLTATSFVDKLDIGPVYNHAMASRSFHSDFAAQEREFVFDIDSGDYDTVRRCCSGASICPKCWRYMELAVPLIALLCRTCGFQQLIYMFSGRRGLHAWVCDPEARSMSVDMRANVLGSINLVPKDVGDVIEVAMDYSNWLCRFVVDRICSPFFFAMLPEQDWLGGAPEVGGVRPADGDDYLAKLRSTTVEAARKGPAISWFCKVVITITGIHSPVWGTGAESGVQASPPLLKQFTRFLKWIVEHPATTSVERWERFSQSIKGDSHLDKALILYLTYPRLDINVTKVMNHLLKVPFSLHYKSRRVSVPINPVGICEEYGLDPEAFGFHESRWLRKKFQVSDAPECTPDGLRVPEGAPGMEEYVQYLGEFVERLRKHYAPGSDSPP